MKNKNVGSYFIKGLFALLVLCMANFVYAEGSSADHRVSADDVHVSITLDNKTLSDTSKFKVVLLEDKNIHDIALPSDIARGESGKVTFSSIGASKFFIELAIVDGNAPDKQALAHLICAPRHLCSSVSCDGGHLVCYVSSNDPDYAITEAWSSDPFDAEYKITSTGVDAGSATEAGTGTQ